MATGIPLFDIFVGHQQSKQYANQAQAARIEGEMAKLRGTQIGEISRERLRQTLSNIDAIRTARGVNLDSPTGQVIEAKTMKDAMRDEMIARLAETTRASAAMAQARGYSRAAKWAVPLAGIESIITLGQKVATFGAGG